MRQCRHHHITHLTTLSSRRSPFLTVETQSSPHGAQHTFIFSSSSQLQATSLGSYQTGSSMAAVAALHHESVTAVHYMCCTARTAIIAHTASTGARHHKL